MRLAVVLGLCALLAGCGVGSGESVGGVTLQVTRDFGTRELPGSPRTDQAPGGETAMRLLQRSFEVDTRYGGGFVQRIEGIAGGRAGGRPVDWFFYVNGVEAPKGAASTELHRGDVVWWDHHDWGATNRVPAVVGSFPAPFENGLDGEKLPVRVECAPGFDAECTAVRDALGEVGVIAGQASLNTRGGEETLRVLVGPWPEVRADFTLRGMDDGPQGSGVYARFADGGARLEAYDPRGRVRDTFGPGTGLVAATATEDSQPVWVVTGTDRAGIAMAARNFTEDALRRKFAVAFRDDRPVALPIVEAEP